MVSVTNELQVLLAPEIQSLTHEVQLRGGAARVFSQAGLEFAARFLDRLKSGLLLGLKAIKCGENRLPGTKRFSPGLVL